MSTLYILIATFSVVGGALGVALSRRRRARTFDQVSQSVLNRLRTEYR